MANTNISCETVVDKLIVHNINVNSIATIAKRHYLSQHLIKYRPDAVLISETGLNKRHKVNFKNYNFIRSDKIGRNRGTGILIASKFDYKIVSNLNINSIENTAIQLNQVNGSKVLLVSIYANDSSNFDELEKIFRSSNIYDYIVCGGDFNARHTSWSNYNVNPNGVKLYDWYQFNINIFDIALLHSLLPSRYGHNSFSFIDLYIVTNNLINDGLSPLLETIDFESDHLVVVLPVQIPQVIRKEPTFILNYKKANWKNLNRQVSLLLSEEFLPINRNLSNQEIDIAIDKINDIINIAIKDNIPLAKINPNNLLILDEIIIKLMKIKKRMRRSWYSSGRNNSTIKSLINRITVIIKEKINLQQSKNLHDVLLAIKPGPSLFQSIKRISNYGIRNSVVQMDGCNDNFESAEKLAEYFENVHNSSNELVSCDDETVNAFIDDLNSLELASFNFSNQFTSDRKSESIDEGYLEFASVDRIASIIKNRRNIKSAGFSKISNYVIRKLPIDFVKYITVIINNSYNNLYFPDKWKSSIVIPIPKTNNISSEVGNFRPISLLCCISKIYECYIKEILVDYCETNNINNKFQFGFTKGKSTYHAHTLFLEKMHDGFSRKEPTLAVTIDLSKAFDKVWINGLIFKLKVFGFQDSFCKLMLSYLNGRDFTVKFNDKNSLIHSIRAGVPQGSILGPSLFNLYITDFPTDWEGNVQTLFFADDILLFKSEKNVRKLLENMNNFIEKVIDYLYRWKLTINKEKCETVLFRKSEKFISKKQKKFKENFNIEINFDGHIIIAKDQFKYLGVQFQKKCSFIPHIDKTIKKASAAFSILRGVFTRKCLTIRTKEVCYKQLIKPILQYGYPAWSSISSHQMNRIRSLERKVLYKCLPHHVAYSNDNLENCFKLIPKIELYSKFKNYKRIDSWLFDSFIRFINKLAYSDIERLNSICNIDYLNEKYADVNEKFFYKSFSPSYLFKLYLDNKTRGNNGEFTFYNRRYNNNNLEDYIYDLIDPG